MDCSGIGCESCKCGTIPAITADTCQDCLIRADRLSGCLDRSYCSCATNLTVTFLSNKTSIYRYASANSCPESWKNTPVPYYFFIQNQIMTQCQSLQRQLGRYDICTLQIRVTAAGVKRDGSNYLLNTDKFHVEILSAAELELQQSGKPYTPSWNSGSSSQQPVPFFIDATVSLTVRNFYQIYIFCDNSWLDCDVSYKFDILLEVKAPVLQTTHDIAGISSTSHEFGEQTSVTNSGSVLWAKAWVVPVVLGVIATMLITMIIVVIRAINRTKKRNYYSKMFVSATEENMDE